MPPVNTWLANTVSALVYSVGRGQRKPECPLLEPPYNDLTCFLLEQLGRMPDYLRPPIGILTLGFDLFRIVRGGALFHSRDAAKRAVQLAAWKKSPLSFQRDFVRYYESLASLALYSRGLPQLGQPALASTGQETSAKSVLTNPDKSLRCEAAVIGSGPGGAITACLLAEAGKDVVLVEEGPYYALESCQPFSKEEMVQKYRNGGQTVALGRNKVAYVEGRCVGGGSEINSGLYHRTPPEVLERWRKEYQVEGLAENDLRPYFEACEKDVSVSLMPGPAPAAALKLHEGALRLGWKSFEVPRWFRYDSDTGNEGTRQSMTKTFVPRFFRAGGRLLPQTRVNSLRQEGTRWLVHAGHAKNGPLQIEADTLFVCAGAVQTPALLRRSGITQNIGNSLKLHPTVKLVAQFAEEVTPQGAGVPSHQVKEFAPRLSFGCSISSPPYLALGMLDHPEVGLQSPEVCRHMANYYAMTAGDGQGTVRCIPGFRDPLVRYQLTLAERRDLADGLRKLAELLFTSGAVALYPCVNGSKPLSSPRDVPGLADLLPDGAGNLMTIHLFSSCPMGEDRSKCATDSFGRVHGFPNLRVSDASLLCTPPGVNPQGSIMALARRNALHFLNNPKD